MLALDTLLHRLRHGCATLTYPAGPAPALPDRHGGALRFTPELCRDDCHACRDVCPTEAFTTTVAPTTPAAPGPTTGATGPRAPSRQLDLARCLFCGACTAACPTGAVRPTGDHRLAVRHRADLRLGALGQEELRLAAALEEKRLRLFGRSLRLRQVSAGGCNACEADTNVLGTIGWDLGRFGIQFVASPRHADGLLITGPVTRAMSLALRKTWDAVPAPKLVIAVGACALAGGPFVGHPEVLGGADALLPVDLYLPGCPPHPLTILDGLLRLLDRLDDRPAPARPSA